LPDFTDREGRTTVPLRFEPMQSWFVVFRKCSRLAARDAGKKTFLSRSERTTLAGPWHVTFDPKWGGPDRPVVFRELTDWSKHNDTRVRHYSGTAVYRKSFELAHAGPHGLLLDVGKVEVMARVRLNGEECGIAWKPPYLVDIARAARRGENELEIDVVNLWINRMIGDEQLPEDSNWLDFETLANWPDWFKTGAPRSSGRFTFTTAKHYRKDSPLAPSGLLGAVKVQTRVILKENQ
jgi:hypothetical protein